MLSTKKVQRQLNAPILRLILLTADIERTKSERFCGDYFPFGMLSVGIPGSTVRIRFKTDDTLTSTGFFMKMGVYEPKPQQFVYPRQTSNMNFLVRQEALREQKADFTQGLGLE